MAKSSKTSAQRVFITGGASGLGLAFARVYAGRGCRVAIGDINAERLNAAKKELEALGAAVIATECDVRQIVQLEAVRDLLLEQWGGVDVVINNAGVATGGDIDAGALEDWDWVIDINLMGVVRGCRVFTPVFREQGNGLFINVASAAGLLSPPGMDSYNVTKAGVVALSETLKVEQARYGISVTVACPAFFQTNLTESIRAPVPGMDKMVNQLMSKSELSADDVAQAVVTGAERGELVVAPHKLERRLWWLKRIAPDAYYRLVRQRFEKLAKKMVRAA